VVGVVVGIRYRSPMAMMIASYWAPSFVLSLAYFELKMQCEFVVLTFLSSEVECINPALHNRSKSCSLSMLWLM